VARVVVIAALVACAACKGVVPATADAGAQAPADLATPAAVVDLARAVDDASDAASLADLAPVDLARVDLAPAPDLAPPCTTRITYGDAWIHPAAHPSNVDIASGAVTWDGTCTDDGANSYALFSNGWKPYFSGHGACVIALDESSCGTSAACATRISYGSAWLPPANHPARYDDVAGRVTWDRVCHASGGQSFATLSNGWTPTFSGGDACALSLSYTQCGGLYQNSILPAGCADPGVVRDGSRYVLACTSGNAHDAFPLFVSSDLVSWSSAGAIFPSTAKPSWATSDFWAPEIHRVGAQWVAYFTARASDGQLSIGAATAASATGPFHDSGAPLVHDAAMGLIDATEFEDAGGTRYLVWKEDGNAVGKPTPIRGQTLASDGLSLTGSATTLITNDQTWEGAVTEGPWLIAQDGYYYLFYSGNSYANASYAVGVARASAPLGPYSKASGPIVTSSSVWIGPGHCSVVNGPGGDTYMLYHAWAAGHVNGPGDVRELLLDRVVWANGWPALPGAPSTTSLPLP
jgi:GH43 family beta-xylosidase